MIVYYNMSVLLNSQIAINFPIVLLAHIKFILSLSHPINFQHEVHQITIPLNINGYETVRNINNVELLSVS